MIRLLEAEGQRQRGGPRLLLMKDRKISLLARLPHPSRPNDQCRPRKTRPHRQLPHR